MTVFKVYDLACQDQTFPKSSLKVNSQEKKYVN